MDRAVSREVGFQECHLIGQYASALEINVLRMRWSEGNGNERHMRLLWCHASFVVITAYASRDDILPGIRATQCSWCDMITGKQCIRKLTATVQADVLITSEKCWVIQWRRVVRIVAVAIGMYTVCRDDSIQRDRAAFAGQGIDATTDGE